MRINHTGDKVSCRGLYNSLTETLPFTLYKNIRQQRPTIEELFQVRDQYQYDPDFIFDLTRVFSRQAKEKLDELVSREGDKAYNFRTSFHKNIPSGNLPFELDTAEIATEALDRCKKKEIPASYYIYNFLSLLYRKDPTKSVYARRDTETLRKESDIVLECLKLYSSDKFHVENLAKIINELPENTDKNTILETIKKKLEPKT